MHRATRQALNNQPKPTSVITNAVPETGFAFFYFNFVRHFVSMQVFYPSSVL